MNARDNFLQARGLADLSAAEAQSLAAALKQRQARREFVLDCFDDAVLAEILRAGDASALPNASKVSEQQVVAQPPASAPSRRIRNRRLLPWALAAGLLLALRFWSAIPTAEGPTAEGPTAQAPTAHSPTTHPPTTHPPTAQAGLHAHLTASAEGVTVERGGRVLPMPVAEHFALHNGDVIHTADNANAQVVYTQEKTWIDFSDRTELEIRHTDKGKFLVLRAGRFEASVAPQPEGQPMICETSLGKAVVLGTRFFMTAENDYSALEVQRGSVRLHSVSGSQATEVKERQFAKASRNGGVLEGELGANGRFEAESLLYHNAQGQIFMRREQGLASGDYQRDFQPRRSGDSVSFLLPVSAPGTYEVVVGAAKFRNRGVYQLAISSKPSAEFQTQGPPKNYYNDQGYAYEEFNLGTIALDSAGEKYFRFTSVGHGAFNNSDPQKLGLDYIFLRRVDSEL